MIMIQKRIQYETKSKNNDSVIDRITKGTLTPELELTLTDMKSTFY